MENRKNGKVTLVCGKICCGKTTFANSIAVGKCAVLLSVDDVMLSVFGQFAGEKHDEYVRGVKNYLLTLGADLIGKEIDVILDWGFWTIAERVSTKEFFASRGIECELIYLYVGDAAWRERVAERNRAVESGECRAYYVDENLADKFSRSFEPPARFEVDEWIEY